MASSPIIARTFRRGAPVEIVETITDFAVDTNVHTARGRMKPAMTTRPNEMPGDEVANTEPKFTSTITAAAGADPARMTHTLTAAETVELEDGLYVFDSSILQSGDVIQTTAPVVIQFTNAASIKD